MVRLTDHPNGVHFTALSPQPFPSTVPVERWVSHYLSLDDDLTGFYAAAAGDHPRFRAVVADLNGLHQVRFPTVLEAAVWFVLSQRTPQPVSMRTKRRIAETYGGRVVVAGQAYQAFLNWLSWWG